MKTIHDVRRENLATVIQTHWQGKAARLAAKLKCEKTVLSRIKSETKSRRNMGAPLARKIEDASGLDRGWMDTDHNAKPADISEYAWKLAEQIEQLPVADQQMVEMLVAHARRRLNQ